MTETHAKDMVVREMVMVAALGVAAEAVKRSRSVGLTVGQVTEDIDAAGVSWKVHAIFYAETDLVRVTGVAELAREHVMDGEQPPVGEAVGVVSNAVLVRLFGSEGPRPQFDVTAPASWVLRAHEASP